MMIARELRIAVPDPAVAVGRAVRLAATLLCLAGVAVLVVALRLGIYEYFHGEGRVLAWAWEVLHLG
jgi:hypothetical protein